MHTDFGDEVTGMWPYHKAVDTMYMESSATKSTRKTKSMPNCHFGRFGFKVYHHDKNLPFPICLNTIDKFRKDFLFFA